MYILLVVSALLAAPLLFVIINSRLNGNPVYYWWITFFLFLLGWLVMLSYGFQLPFRLELPIWKNDLLGVSGLTFHINDYSWPFAFVFIGTLTGVLLTETAYPLVKDWQIWAEITIFAAFGILGVLADDPYTLLIIWAAIDSLELFVLLSRINNPTISENIIVAFSGRIASICLVIAALIAVRGEISFLILDVMRDQSAFYLLIAAGLRIGVLPIQRSLEGTVLFSQGMDLIHKLVPMVTGFSLLPHVASGQPLRAGSGGWFLLLLAVAALWWSVQWSLNVESKSAFSYWTLGLFSISIYAAILGLSHASLAWGLVALSSGSAIILYTAKAKWLRPVLILSMLPLTMLPILPTWSGFSIYEGNLNVNHILIMAAQAVLLLGYFRFLFQPSALLSIEIRGIKVFYTLGLLFLPLTYIAAGFLPIMEPGKFEYQANWFAIGGVLGGVVLGIVVLRQPVKYKLRPVKRGWKIFSFSWMYQWFWRLYHFFAWFVRYITRILEGQGGVFWALLLLVLLFSLFGNDGR